jgi:hypothetical protein
MSESIKSEADLYAPILTEWSVGTTRLLRVNAGQAWQGEIVERSAQRLVLLNPYPIRLATPGVSDLIGFTSINVASLYHSNIERVAIFCAIELKSERGRVNPEQRAFIEVVNRAGGRAGVARSVEDAGRIIAGDKI